ncbi:hypothetical protein IAT38_002082 [Cryptococcus sp. DSM 104549]
MSALLQTFTDNAHSIGSQANTSVAPTHVNPMKTASEVVWALKDKEMTQNPEYVKAIIRSYIEEKQAHGRSKDEIGDKLQPLEQEFPRFAPSFVAVRKEYELPKSEAIEKMVKYEKKKQGIL